MKVLLFTTQSDNGMVVHADLGDRMVVWRQYDPSEGYHSSVSVVDTKIGLLVARQRIEKQMTISDFIREVERTNEVIVAAKKVLNEVSNS